MPGTKTGKLRVLAVDDDSLVLLNTTAMLEDLGHVPVGAMSGNQALALLEAGEVVDLVITDQAMPGMTGVQLVEAVRLKLPSVPVILGTGYAEIPAGGPQPRTRLAKPFGPADLAKAIEAAVQQAA
jgi:CheY-like chemotaxis protein